MPFGDYIGHFWGGAPRLPYVFLMAVSWFSIYHSLPALNVPVCLYSTYTVTLHTAHMHNHRCTNANRLSTLTQTHAQIYCLKTNRCRATSVYQEPKISFHFH